MITFTVTIHGPFHISAGESGDGADNVVDRDNPLPASSLKGLMRAAAADLLGLPDTLIADVFGAPGPAGSPWRWSDGRVAAPEFGRYARIKVDPAGRVSVVIVAEDRGGSPSPTTRSGPRLIARR